MRYLVGVLALGVVVVSLAAASRTIRRRVMPALDGPPRVLAEIVLTLSIVVVTSEVLGTFGLFELVPVVAVTASTGVVAVYARRRAPRYRGKTSNENRISLLPSPRRCPGARTRRYSRLP